jgi:hypothetical protein
VPFWVQHLLEDSESPLRVWDPMNDPSRIMVNPSLHLVLPGIIGKVMSTLFRHADTVDSLSDSTSRITHDRIDAWIYTYIVKNKVEVDSVL